MSGRVDPRQALREIARLRLTDLPTPVEECRRIVRAVPGLPTLFIKRDDRLGSLCGGNKLRKLEYTMADAVEHDATAVVTIGGVQSNMARITAEVARRLDLRCELVLSGEPPKTAAGNFLVSELLGIPVHHVAKREEREPRMEEVARDLERKGERVYRIPLGASDPVGSAGFAHAVEELRLQEERLGAPFDSLFVSTSSGGTQAGLEAGKRIAGRESLKIVGVSADNPARQIREVVVRVADAILERVGSPVRVDPAEVRVDDTFFGEGYGIPTEASEQARKVFAEREGILLDPVYTAKAAAALLEYARRGFFAPTDRVLFWHTGGLLNLFG
jgi:1-aminocyclopropane-1-carboxylate deaminase/D-cysteine desulfhydrase-like pyridoxal-dependent ACC family enzyme